VTKYQSIVFGRRGVEKSRIPLVAVMEKLLSDVPPDAWTTRLSGVPATEHSDLDKYFVSDGSFVDGAGKARDEGLTLWIDEYVRSVRVHLDLKREIVIVTGRVRPSMRSTSPYTTSFVLNADGGIGGGACNCKGGARGLCKHVAALWYRLWSLQKQNVAEIPADKSSTDVPAYWKERRDPGTSTITFRNVTIVKHKHIAVGTSDADAAELLNPARPAHAESYQPFPNPVDSIVTTAQLRRLME